MEQSRMDELAERARSGDEEAFAKLYETIYQDLYRFALYTLQNPHEAEDAVSETVLDGFYEIKKLRQAGAFRGWMMKILTVKCKKKLKSYVNRAVSIEDQEIALPCEDRESVQDLYRALAKLRDRDRLILNMAVVAGFSSKEIAHLLHMNSNTVRSVESRALEKLRTMLEE